MSVSAMHATRTVLDRLPRASHQTSRYLCQQCRHTTSPNVTIIQRRRYASKPDPKQGKQSALERVRGMLWKGEPPGPKNIDDVYGGPGFIQSIRDERKRKQAARNSDPLLMERLGQKIDAKLKDYDQRTRQLEEENEHLARSEAHTDGQQRAMDRHLKSLPEDYPEDAPKFSYTASMPDPLDSDIPTITSLKGLESIGHQGQLEFLPIRQEDTYRPYMISVKSSDISSEELIQQWLNVNTTRGAEDALDINEPQDRKLIEKFSKAISFRIPDSILNNHRHSTDKSVNAFLASVHKALAPKLKLADQLLADEAITDNPNLLIINRREKLVDKETDLGRWKLIEAEFKARGLSKSKSDPEVAQST